VTTPTTPTIGIGTKFMVETAVGSGVYQYLANIKDVSPPNASIAELDTTNMDSPDNAEEQIPGLTNYGDMSLPMLYADNSDTDQIILAWRASQTAGANRKGRIVYRSGRTDTFPCFIKGYQPNIPVNGVCEATLTLKVAGAVVTVR
jgi:hypothetical protein